MHIFGVTGSSFLCLGSLTKSQTQARILCLNPEFPQAPAGKWRQDLARVSWWALKGQSSGLNSTPETPTLSHPQLLSAPWR